MKIESLIKLLESATPEQAMRLMMAVRNPVIQIEEGWDLSNVTAQSIAGCVRFGVFASAEDSTNPKKFATGYVTWVNGPMSDHYRFSEADLQDLEKQHGSEAAAGLRNQHVICFNQTN